eukprot:TRINITY_DN6247_c0_g1_i1.p1 TRINITY_DN6247_c0_g1~~TRINITY_DN6247_c0_g1_i1.p1  ORF type:complete len:222 (-),score=62.51 TRINITY_DN6247_c0_g1_i1:74-739(-)
MLRQVSRAITPSLSRTFATNAFKLPDLPYSYGALEPVISGQIMELHHSKHHATYVKNLNAALEQYAEAEKNQDIQKQIQLQGAIKFNGGGHINHSIFWTNLAPTKEGGGEPPKGELADKINNQFGSLDKLIEKMSNVSVAVQGSGWGWLAYNKELDRLEILSQQNQDPISVTGFVPLLGIDVWEHAYYLDYKNVRPDYVKNIWKIVNWNNVSERYQKARSK